jgi:hypothetical protein
MFISIRKKLQRGANDTPQGRALTLARTQQSRFTEGIASLGGYLDSLDALPDDDEQLSDEQRTERKRRAKLHETLAERKTQVQQVTDLLPQLGRDYSETIGAQLEQIDRELDVIGLGNDGPLFLLHKAVQDLIVGPSGSNTMSGSRFEQLLLLEPLRSAWFDRASKLLRRAWRSELSSLSEEELQHECDARLANVQLFANVKVRYTKTHTPRSNKIGRTFLAHDGELDLLLADSASSRVWMAIEVKANMGDIPGALNQLERNISKVKLEGGCLQCDQNGKTLNWTWDDVKDCQMMFITRSFTGWQLPVSSQLLFFAWNRLYCSEAMKPSTKAVMQDRIASLGESSWRDAAAIAAHIVVFNTEHVEMETEDVDVEKQQREQQELKETALAHVRRFVEAHPACAMFFQ